MAYSNIKKILFVLLCIFIVLFPFWCVRGLCSETEEVEISSVSNLRITSTSNVFSYAEQSFWNVGYFSVDDEYLYYIYNPGPNIIPLATSNNVPAVGENYNFITQLEVGDTYTYRGNQDLYFCSRSGEGYPVVTRQKIENMDGAVSDLVEYVGIQSLWNTFNDANPFLLVVVLFSFGLFIIIVLVRKLRKGKGGF